MAALSPAEKARVAKAAAEEAARVAAEAAAAAEAAEREAEAAEQALSGDSAPQLTEVSAAGQIAAGYAAEGTALELGTVVVDGAVDRAARVRIPLATMNRHGLVAGATGTGKTKTLQGIAEQLSAAGVPVVLADVKGDLSGLSAKGESNDKIAARAAESGDDGWAPPGSRSNSSPSAPEASGFRCVPPSRASGRSC